MLERTFRGKSADVYHSTVFSRAPGRPQHLSRLEACHNFPSAARACRTSDRSLWPSDQGLNTFPVEAHNHLPVDDELLHRRGVGAHVPIEVLDPLFAKELLRPLAEQSNSQPG